MRIYYFVHVSATDQGISGIPRVVKSLARELLSMAGVELVPVSWSAIRETLVHTEQKLLDNLALHGGPAIKASDQALEPIEPAPGDWLLVPEAPHLGSNDPDYPSLLLDELIGFARSVRLPVAVLLHDIMPLTHRMGSDRRSAFADMVSAADRGDDGERQRLRFAVFAHAVASADLVLPVSRTSADLLGDWLIRNGHRPDQLPPILPILLPEQALTGPRVVPHRLARHKARPKEFLSVGTVGVHKNQLAAMAAFQRLVVRRPDLDVRFNVVGSVTSEVAVSASQLAKWSKGRIVLHGMLPDKSLGRLWESSCASVFVSLAEGYGLPVAESLWRGKPCICSDDGSIAEIAAGGGCLLVNPLSLEEIELAFELLATDEALYEELSQEIAARDMKTWRQYAADVVDHIRDCSEGRLQLPERSGRRTADEGRAKSAILTLSAADLHIPDAYARGERMTRHLGAICFERDKDGGIREHVLFFGPYVWLPAGTYAFALDGEISGALDLAMTAEQGKRKLARVNVESFDEPIVVDLPEAVNGFEIVGHRTPSLDRLVLRGAMIEYRAHSFDPAQKATPRRARGPEAMKPAAAAGERVAPVTSEPAAPAPVYGRDDDGKPVSFPYTIPADGMRVHDAYNAGADSILRSNSTIAFRIGDHGRVEEYTLFFGPYLSLEPGDYTIRIDGDLDGRLCVRLTQKFASERLLETIVKSFEEPIRLKLTSPAEKFEIMGLRIGDTLSMTLRAIEIVREPAERVEELVEAVNVEEFGAADAVSAVQEVPAVQRIPAVRKVEQGLRPPSQEAAVSPEPVSGAEDRTANRGGCFIWDTTGRALSLPLTIPATELIVRNAFGVGSGNSLRAGAKIEFDASSQGAVHEPVLFSGATLRLAPGEYSFQLRGALKGSLKLRFTNGPRGERLQDALVKTFDAPVRVLVEEPLDSFEIVGLRTKNTLAMSLASIEVSASPLISSS